MINEQKSPKQEDRFYNALGIELGTGDPKIAERAEKNPNGIKRTLVVKNGNKPIRECQIILENLQYHFGNEWIDPPNGYEQKALRWLDEDNHLDGKRDISADRSTFVEIARLFRFPNPFFGIAYFDGGFGKTHHFVGTYKLRLRIQGKVNKRKNLWDMEAVLYDVFLNYAGARELEIIKIEGASAT